MCVELPKYLAEAKGLIVNRTDVDDFTEAVLQFWRNKVLLLPAWAGAARIVLAVGDLVQLGLLRRCERVFSLLDSMFGKEQLRALADYVGRSLMLEYNKRTIG